MILNCMKKLMKHTARKRRLERPKLKKKVSTSISNFVRIYFDSTPGPSAIKRFTDIILKIPIS